MIDLVDAININENKTFPTFDPTAELSWNDKNYNEYWSHDRAKNGTDMS